MYVTESDMSEDVCVRVHLSNRKRSRKLVNGRMAGFCGRGD
jgi:hypothetical protein